MLRLLTDSHSRAPENAAITAVEQGVIYEHIRVTGNTLTVTGEHIMASAGPLHLRKDFFGADEAITSPWENQTNWVATLIICAESRTAAWKKRKTILADIIRFFKLSTYRDPGPKNPYDDKQIQQLKGQST